MEGSILSLVPSIITIGLILLTRRLFLSLGIGIIFGVLIIDQWNPIAGIVTIYEIMLDVIMGDGKILLFVLFVGVMSALINQSGGIHAFSEWAVKKVKTRSQAQLTTILIGFIVFFDDACNSFLRGNIMRPLTDQYQIARSKLSYLVHASTASVSLMIPISGIAAATATIIGGVLIDNGVTTFGGFEAFVRAIPSNYYAISCLIMVFAATVLKLDIGRMKKNEKRAIETGVLVESNNMVNQNKGQDYVRNDGRVLDLMLPLALLIGTIVIYSLWTGFANVEGDPTLSGLLLSMDIVSGLLYGILLACAYSIIRLVIKKETTKNISSALVSGAKTTLPSVLILLFALMTASIMSSLGVGTFLASIFDGNIAGAWIPVILFVIAAFMCFSTGSTFGTLVLFIPIGAEIVTAIDPMFIIPAIGAVIAGGIFGEHSSPLSDTTILSSTGSRIHPIDHIMSQLPYTLIGAAVSIVGYIFLGLTSNALVGLLVTVLLLGLVIFFINRLNKMSAVSDNASSVSDVS